MKRQLQALIFIMVGCYALFEFSTGVEAWDQAKSAYLADGESLDPAIRFASPVPAEENFGAIPELVGITAPGEKGELVRKKIRLLGFTDPDVRRPIFSGKSIRGHSASSKYDFSPLHDYFLETGILPVTPEPMDIAYDVCSAIETKHGKLLSELLQASEREHSRFLPLVSGTAPTDSIILTEDIGMLMPIQAAAVGLTLYSVTLSRTNRTEKAIDVVRTQWQLAEATGADRKSLIHYSVAQAVQSLALSAIWDGMDTANWTSDQLQEIESLISDTNPRHEAIEALRVEAIATDQILDLVISDPGQLAKDPLLENWNLKYSMLLAPLMKHNRARSLNLFHEALITPLKGTATYSEINTISTERVDDFFVINHRHPRGYLSGLAIHSLRRAIIQAARHQANLTNAITACQLERYYLKHKSYPTTLDALVPEFAKKLPLDPMNNDPLRYKRTADGRYQLYSIGLDDKDDNGAKGDIVWTYQLSE